jgi:PAS domain S-box-containing protein
MQATYEPPEARLPAVLIVDDDRDTLVAIEAILDGQGYRLFKAEGGHEALRMVLREDFAVILLDVVMAGMDGLEVARLIKTRRKCEHVPIIFLTGKSGPEPAALAYATGAVDYLEKPVTPEVVRAKVASLVQLYMHGQDLWLRESASHERERRVLEERSRRRYRNLAESIPQIVWTSVPDGAIDYLNQRFGAFTGLRADGALGWGWTAAVHEDDVPALLERWRAAVATERPLEAEARLRRRDGGFRWHLWRAEPERDDAGRVVAWLGTATDIEDQKEAQAEARRAVAVRDEFLSVASHELRTPLTALSLSLQSLLRNLRRGRPAPENLAERLEGLRSQSGRLERLIEQLLDVTRIEGGRLAIEPQDADLAAVVREAGARMEGEAKRAGCELRLDLCDAVQGVWDVFRLEQVVTNLLTNAIKYGAGRPIDVLVREGPGGKARLAVTDHGIGIDPAEQGRIFERFARAVSAESYGGLGLGLYITRQIVLAHGGEIHVQSAPEQGATFTVELPRGQVAVGAGAGRLHEERV